MKAASTEYARVKEIVAELYPKWEEALAHLEAVKVELGEA
jgi:hypothetical protein